MRSIITEAHQLLIITKETDENACMLKMSKFLTFESHVFKVAGLLVYLGNY